MGGRIKLRALSPLPTWCMLRSYRGFTLVELLISIGIFLLITSLVIVNFRQGQYRDELMGSAELIENALREAQTLTTTGATVTCPGDSVSAVPPGGFGLSAMGPDNVIVFADCEEPPTYTYAAADDLVIRTLKLAGNVEINAFDPAGPELDLVFSPFDEKVRVNGSLILTDPALIRLRHKRTNAEAQVQTNVLTGQVFSQ